MVPVLVHRLAPLARANVRTRAGAHRCAYLRRFRADPLSDELGVVFDEADQRRAARVLPGLAEEVKARNLRDPAVVTQTAIFVEDRQLDPRVIGAVAGRPDDGVDLELAAVVEARSAGGRVEGPGVGVDPRKLGAVAAAPAR